MYEAGTILALKEPRGTDETPFPYDRVEVIGQSPISHAATSEWSGAAAQGVIIKPCDEFGSTLDEPEGKLKSIYKVESTPDREVTAEPIRVVRPETAGPTPEEQFESVAGPKVESRRAKRRRESPLNEGEDVKRAAEAEARKTGVLSPLDESPNEQE